jgi:hypothetical protein
MTRAEPIPSLPEGETPVAHPKRMINHLESDMSSIFNFSGNLAVDQEKAAQQREEKAFAAAALRGRRFSNSPMHTKQMALAHLVDGSQPVMVSQVGNRPDRLRRGRGAANPDVPHGESNVGSETGRSGIAPSASFAGLTVRRGVSAAEAIGFGSVATASKESPRPAAPVPYSTRRRLSQDYRGTLVIA